MHGGNVALAGPVWWLAVAFFGVAWLLSAYVVLDALRSRRAERLSELPESRWLYITPSAAFIVVAVVAQFANVALLAVGVVIAAPVVIGLALAYLLRVVFPAQAHVPFDEDEPDDAESGAGLS